MIRTDENDGRVHKLAAALHAVAIPALAVGVMVVVVLLTARAELFDPASVRDFVLRFGPAAPVIWALLYVLSVFIPYAASAMTYAAGLAFGVVWGSVLVFCVTLFASLVPFSLARRLGRRWVEKKVGNSRVEEQVRLINRHAFIVFFYLRLLPTLPYEVQNYIAGVSRITVKQFLLASALGNGPVIFAQVFLGDTLNEPGSGRFWMAAGVLLAIGLAPVVVAILRRKTGGEQVSNALSTIQLN